jgi:hypothetical protein
MLLREEGDAVLCIGQASHAWLSGQLARAWAGLDGARREAVCLAAEQHDVAWGAWDLRPRRDPETGRPLGFLDISHAERLAIWERAPERLLSQSAYAALLVSLHGTRLHEGESWAADYRRAQEELQRRLLAQTGVAEADARHDRDLLAAWDGLSLALCLRWDPFDDRGRRLERVEGETFTLDPWPFAGDRVEARCEGRRLDGRYADDEALYAALAEAAPRTLRFTLRPAR